MVAVSVFVVLAIGVPAVAKLSKEDSHLTTDPVCPLKVNVVLLVPEQTVAAPATVPPSDTGVILTVAAALFAGEQTPL